MPADEPPPRSLLGWTDATARPQLDVALSHPIALLANALGPPPEDVTALAHDHGVKVAALVGRADQARTQRQAGGHIIVGQGAEAGGHTGEVAPLVAVPRGVHAVAPAPGLAARAL